MDDSSPTYTVADIAWAAGFIDGEGCFTLAKSGRSSASAYWRAPLVSAGQKTLRPLEKLHSMFGGKIYGPQKSGMWYWKLQNAEQVRTVVPILLPYLVVKQLEAEIVLAYAQEMQPVGRKGKPKGLSEPEQLRRRELILRLSLMRGRVM